MICQNFVLQTWRGGDDGIISEDYMNDEVKAIMLENLQTTTMTPFQAALNRAALGIKIVFKRETEKGLLYLNELYKWGDIPNGFDEWEADSLQFMFHKWHDAPTHWGWCRGDVDKVEWVEL